MKTTILFVAEVEFKQGNDVVDFVKVRFADKFDGYKQNADGEFEVARVDEVVMYKSAFLAQIFTSIPELALAYTRTESFACIRAALQKVECELIRTVVTDEDSDHNRYTTEIKDIKVSERVQAMLDKEIERAFE